MKFLGALYFRIFQPLLVFGEKASRDTAQALRAARMGFFPEWYLSLSYFSAAAAGVGVFLLSSTVSIAFLDAMTPFQGLVIVIGTSLAAALLVRLAFLLYPRMVASSRARRIDAEFPSIVTLCYALARGGMSIVDIFRVITEEEKTYGEISKEFGLIVRDIDWFGLDVNTALLNTAATSPSQTLRQFLEGLVTILNSGAAPRDYFRRQAETQMSRMELELEQEIEQAGLLAEVYVSGLLVLPLLLIVILSVLSGLGSGGEEFLPLIVFGIVPLGTAGYLIVVDMLSPAESLQAPKRATPPIIDFGLEALSSSVRSLPPPGRLLWHEADEPASAARVRFSLAMQSLGQRLRRAWSDVAVRALEQPTEFLAVSGTTALLVFAGGLIYILLRNAEGYQLTLSLTSLGLGALILAVLPVAIFHELRVRRTRSVDGALPETLRKLSGFNERGIGLLSAFQLLGRERKGVLTPALATMDREVTWTSNFRGALARMCARAGSVRLSKVGLLFDRASAATGNLKEVIEIVAHDTSSTEKLRSRKRQAMMTYVVIIYAVFAVFLYVVYMVTTLFFSEGGLAMGMSAASAGPGGGAPAGLAPDTARLLFFHAVLLQGVCCGLVAGRLGEGYLLSGLKHAALLGAIAWVVFYAGVV